MAEEIELATVEGTEPRLIGSVPDEIRAPDSSGVERGSGWAAGGPSNEVLRRKAAAHTAPKAEVAPEEVTAAPSWNVPPVTLCFDGLNFVVDVKVRAESGKLVPGKRTLLDKVTGLVEPGECLAIMGPTGSGKTTLLDSLAGKIGSGYLTGDVLLNGRPRDTVPFKRLAAYVQQFDSLLGTLTVLETLMYSAELNLPATLARSEKLKVVNTVIDQLGLRSVADRKIGNALIAGISGGQKKRVSIGIELIAQPSLVFLDEPTTGLDSASALNVMEKITKIARDGRTVLTTIHQPSSELFALFDKLMLLSRGKVVYFGPAQKAVNFFEGVGHPVPAFTNPTDFFLDVINTDFNPNIDIDGIIRGYKESEWWGDNVARIKQHREQTTNEMSTTIENPLAVKKYGTSIWKQFKVLNNRNQVNLRRNPLVFWMRLAMYVLLSLVMGTLFLGLSYDFEDMRDRISVLFFVVAFMTFMTISVLPEFIEDREIFVRERRNGAYHVSSYVLANTISSLPWVFLIALVTSGILYWMVGLNSSFGRFVIFVVLLFLCLYTAESIMVTVSAIAPQFMMGLALSSGVMGLFMLLCGFFLLPGNIPPYWIWGHFIAFHTYGFRSFMWNDLEGNDVGEEILDKRYDIDPSKDPRPVDIIVLVGMIIIYRCLFYICLRRFQTGKR